MHLLALRISQYLGLRPDPVLKHWAVARIARSKSALSQESDAGLCSAIVEKFEKEGERASYADIAKKAWEAGRVRLATMLLDHESRAAEQVPLLLEMKQDKIALEKAVDSGDTDLVYHVLLRLQSALSPGDFFHLLDDSLTPALTPAVRLLQVYARENNRQLLRDFYYQDDRRVDAGTLYVEEAYATPLADDRAELLRLASKSFAEDKDAAFESKQAEDAARLLQMQAGYEAEADHRVALRGLSLSDTISALITHGLGKRAEALRSAFKVPDKRWWWLKLKALAAAKNWTALETFAKSKKSPIGYEPFVRHLLAVEQPGQAALYVPRCEARHRPDLYVECGLWGKAAEAAKERGDKSKLEEIRQRAPSGLAQREVEEVIRRAK
ncbi:vacuole organization and biogenesis-related protein [Trichosporon asahii var. asahii CBS 8904]|uniref:Vacuole organization and biogenesis-related protein n=1 Tax=Trichosporon asahii var. asahii (strain CBS 8904) TaxID=1220162 RepID=K1W5J4_TRIAC|nr:vacuole organization and biogenesis-related protein [Trichosporon asahii var. asahii CBS 8904]